MSVSATHLTTSGSDVDANSFTTASISPTANALVLAAVAVGKTGTPDTPTLTGNGLTWELEDQIEYDSTGTFGKLFLFRAMGASPTPGTVAIAFGGVTQLGCVWSIAEFTGVDTSGTNGSGAIVQSVPEVETDLGNTASVTLAAFSAAENATYGCVANQIDADRVPGAGFNQLGDTNVATPFIGLMTMWKDTNDTVVDASWTTTGEKSGIIGVEIKAAVAAAETDLGYQRIFGPAQLTASAVTLYTVPAGMRAELRSADLNNPSGSLRKVTLSIGSDAAGTRVEELLDIPAGESENLRRRGNHTLEEGEVLQGYADASGVVVATINAWVESV